MEKLDFPDALMCIPLHARMKQVTLHFASKSTYVHIRDTQIIPALRKRTKRLTRLSAEAHPIRVHTYTTHTHWYVHLPSNARMYKVHLLSFLSAQNHQLCTKYQNMYLKGEKFALGTFWHWRDDMTKWNEKARE